MNTAVAKPRMRDVLASPRMVAILVLGASSGLPYNLTDSTLQAWLKDFGVTNTTIGLLTLVGVPYAWKFLWAPFLDRYSLPLLDRRRGWVLLFQLSLAAAIAYLALQSPGSGLKMIALVVLLIAVLSASQDVVIDAYRTDVARPEERGLAATATNLGYRGAAYFSFAIALTLADVIGWQATFFVLAGLMALFSIGTWFAPKPHYQAPMPRTLVESVTVPLRELFGAPGMVALVLLLLLFKVGDAFALRLFTPFLMDVGFTKTEIGLVAKAVMTTATIAGALLGGIWMIRLGLLRAMLLFGALQAISNLAYLLLATVGRDVPLMVAAVAVDNLAGGMGSVAVVAFIMALCDVRFSAFQYALLSAIAVIPRTYLGWPAGYIADTAGWTTYYWVSFAIGLPGVLLAWLLRDKVHALEKRGQP